MNWQDKRIMVIGDIMVDRFVYGESTRLSPDGPVPVVDYINETIHPGGAANVARNIQTLGARSVLIGVVGKDVDGFLIRNNSELGSNIGIMESVCRQTLTKERLFANGQQVCRLDKGTIKNLNQKEEDYLLRIIYQEIKDVDAIIISDYGKGVITRNLMRMFVEYYKSYSHMTFRPLIIDPKPLNVPWYNITPTVIIPNEKELQEITNAAKVDIAAERVMLATNAENVLVTRGEKGMFLLKKIKDDGLLQSKIGPATNKPKFVAGAGDVVAAVMALGLCSGHTILDTARMANVAAAIAIEKEETSYCNIEELVEKWQR